VQDAVERAGAQHPVDRQRAAEPEGGSDGERGEDGA
jgi:hypothetical protein